MRNTTYWICFALVAFASIYTHSAWAMWNLGVKLPYVTWFSLFSGFGKLMPQAVVHYLPRALVIALDFAVLVFVIRRLWLLAVRRQGVPVSYAGAAKVLGYVGAISFILSVLGMLLSIALHAGSGVPAAMLALPALLCVPWAFTLAEVMGLRAAPQGKTAAVVGVERDV